MQTNKVRLHVGCNVREGRCTIYFLCRTWGHFSSEYWLSCYQYIVPMALGRYHPALRAPLKRGIWSLLV